MSASTQYMVRVLVTKEEWVTVSAVCSYEAEEKAEEMKGVIKVLEVKHWTEA